MVLSSPNTADPSLPEHLQIIDSFLMDVNAPDDRMVLTELDGFLAGVVVSQDMIMPSEWMACIWGDDTAGFVDEKQAQHVMGAIMMMYNSIIEMLQNGAYAPLYDFDNDGSALWEIWLDGFWKAAMLRQKDWEAMILDEKNPELQHTVSTVTRLQQLAFLSGEDMEPLKGDDGLCEHAEDLLPVAVELLHQYRMNQPIIPHRTPVTREKIGRNDPCPCGSGKKFKKCCLH